MRILFVDNHEVFAHLATQQFLGGHEVKCVPTLELARAAGQDFDAVLVDYDLDDGTGDAFVGELLGAGFAGRIIATSSHAAGNAALVAAGAHVACPKSHFSELPGLLQAAD